MMAYLFAKGVKRCDLYRLAFELSLPTTPNMTLLEIMKLILHSEDYDEETKMNILESVRGEREDAENWERSGGKPATSYKEAFYCRTEGYQTDCNDNLTPILLIELGLEKNSIKLNVNEMEFLVEKGVKRCDLFRLAYELSLPTTPNMKLIEIMRLILDSDEENEETKRDLLNIVREEREDAEKWGKLGGKKATSYKESFICRNKGYQIDSEDNLVPSILAELGFGKNAVKLTADQIMSLIYASETFNCKTDAKSDKIQNLNLDVVEPSTSVVESEINHDLISESNVLITQSENSYELVGKEVSETLNAGNIKCVLDISEDSPNDFDQNRDVRGDAINQIIVVDISTGETDYAENQRSLENLANATVDSNQKVDLVDRIPAQVKSTVSVGSEKSDKWELSITHAKTGCKDPKMYTNEFTEIYLVLKAIGVKQDPFVFTIYVPFEVGEPPPNYLMFEMNMWLMYEHWLHPGENYPVNLKEFRMN